ncbi:MAG: Thiol:disulfide interchange protein DsbD [Chlamydiales bacterium]|nr:Thiol:disulfide interchange protein DsbD [Chlamydiales bacterium]MCH9635420.1 Thiol:disulfide interchange protein DsbD [Chlamydiales bacterium]
MKAAILLALLSTTLVYADAPAPAKERHSEGKLVWMDNYEQAMKNAEQQHKPVILYFTGSDWCGWCKKMDQEVFSSPAFAAAVGQKFVFVKVDFPMNSKLPEAQARQNAQLKQRYGVTGYPTVVIVDSKGGFIGETGYRAGGGKAYAQWLEQFLNN